MRGYDVECFTAEELAGHMQVIAEELVSRAMLTPEACANVVIAAGETRVLYEKALAFRFSDREVEQGAADDLLGSFLESIMTTASQDGTDS